MYNNITNFGYVNFRTAPKGDFEGKNCLLRRSRSTGKTTGRDAVKSAVGSLVGTAIPLLFMMKKG